ncbi:unnamed protein product [Adineta ricciae]|uniref:Uncharacterized protein n=1 Tax=Adineta ricciae TaxID=249248 RepID=A0A815NBJ0_ADIRI|nr:unnamed protein product [Adineta ricciae]CAF1435062.1 unnamed protein product [Adineta ricciae]
MRLYFVINYLMSNIHVRTNHLDCFNTLFQLTLTIDNLQSLQMKSKIYAEEIYNQADYIVEGTAFTPLFSSSTKFKSFQTVDDISGMDIRPHLQNSSLKLWKFETINFILQYCPNLKSLDRIVTGIYLRKANRASAESSDIPLQRFSLSMNDTPLQQKLLQLMQRLKHFDFYISCQLRSWKNLFHFLPSFTNSFAFDHN